MCFCGGTEKYVCRVAVAKTTATDVLCFTFIKVITQPSDWNALKMSH